MMTTTGSVVINTSLHELSPTEDRNLLPPSENWDDDFEFQTHKNSHVTEGISESTYAFGNKHKFEEGEESWDDAYADDDGPSSPIRRAPKTDSDDDEEIEDWDSSDNEIEHQLSTAPELGTGPFEEEDKTVTARSTASSRFRSPPPPLPLPLLPVTNVPFEFSAQDTVLPLSIASPTLSTFSIPLSSNRDHSVYSHEGLIRNTSGSAPHLTIMRSYPHGAGSTPPRKGRRLRKKSRHPEVEIIELDDCKPAQPAVTNHRPAAFPQPPPTSEIPCSSQPPSPPATSLLTRIGSFKRWTRRSIGPEDVSYTGWRRTKSSFGPSEITDLPTQDLSLLRSASPASPSAPPPRNRNRGSSASGLKSGWFFRSGEAENIETIPASLNQTSITKPSSPIETQADVILKLNDCIDPESFTLLTPRKSKGRLVPILKSPLKKKADSVKPHSSELAGPVYPRPESSLSISSKHNGHQFPKYSLSVGRHAGSALFTEATEKNNNKDKDGGVRGLVKGVRRLSQVSITGHKRTKSTSKTNDETKSPSDVAEQLTIASTLLPPVELNSPILPTTIFSRNASLSRSDFAYALPLNGNDQQSYTLSPFLRSEEGMSMERVSFSSSRAPSRLEMMDKPSTGSPPRPRPSRRATSPLPSIPPSPPKQPFRPDSAMSNKRPNSATSTRRPGSSSSSCPPVSSQAQALATQSFRPKTPVRNPPSASISSSARPRTPNKVQSGTPPSHQSTAPSAYTASLGRTTTPPQFTRPSLKRNSLNDLRSTPSKPTSSNEPTASDDHSNGDTVEHKSLDHRRASTNTLGDLKIPARISKVQQGLRRDLGMLREFAGYVEQLKRLQNSYMKLIGELCIVYESYPVQRVPSRPPSQIGVSRKGFTNNSNSSTQSIQRASQPATSMLLNSPTKAHATRSYSRSSNDLNRQLSRLDQEYGLWWECAELLVELGGGSSSMTAVTTSNPNLTSHSSSSALSTNTTYDDPPPMPKHHSRSGTHTPSMSDPGSIFHNPALADLNKTTSEVTSPPNQWRASTGRHDLSARQLRLLRDMLNTPDPSALPDNPAYVQVSDSSPPSHPYLNSKTEVWNGRNPSVLTLPSDESFVANGDGAAVEKNKEKRRRLGIIDFLRGIKKVAIAEGRLAPRSESSLSSHTDADDDHYNRRRSPWHQHEIHHLQAPIPCMVPASKSPGRPSLASIFRIGGRDKNSKMSSRNEDLCKIKGHTSKGNRKVSAEGSGVGDADDEQGDCDEWERMSQSELDLANIGSGTGTVRGRKSTKKPSLPSMHRYPYHGATTPKKTPAASRASLLEAVATPSHTASNPVSKPSKHKLRTSSWSQTHAAPQLSTVNAKPPISGTVRSAPPADVNTLPDPKLTLSPDNIKPLLEYAKEVSARLADCIIEVQSLLGQRT